MPDVTMRAAVIDGPATIRIIETEAPEAGAGQVRVRLTGSGVCGSNLPVWEGRPWFSYPLAPGAPGHEGWGQIEQIGPNVSDLRIGEHVAILSQRAFADLDIADASEVVPLLPSVRQQPFPGEAVACAVNVMRRASIMSGQRVAIVGIGFLGAVLVRLAALEGAEVTAITRRRYALEVAAGLGATNLVTLGDVWQTVSEAKTLNKNQAFDVVIEVTGLQAPLDVASQLTTTRGRLVIAGYHQDGPRQIDMQSWNWNGIDVVNAHERDPKIYVEGMRNAVSLVESGALPLETLVTHVFPIDAAAEAFRCAVTRPEGFLKAAVVTHA